MDIRIEGRAVTVSGKVPADESNAFMRWAVMCNALNRTIPWEKVKPFSAAVRASWVARRILGGLPLSEKLIREIATTQCKTVSQELFIWDAWARTPALGKFVDSLELQEAIELVDCLSGSAAMDFLARHMANGLLPAIAATAKGKTRDIFAAELERRGVANAPA